MLYLYLSAVKRAADEVSSEAKKPRIEVKKKTQGQTIYLSFLPCADITSTI